jgi:tripartite-type tricarboxylate transporter receptor subunit TctC
MKTTFACIVTIGLAAFAADAFGQAAYPAKPIRIIVPNLGVEIAAKAPPDGYTAVMAPVTTNAIGMSTYTKLGYHLERDLAPVALAGNVPHILVAHLRVAGPGHALASRAGDAEADGRIYRAPRAVQGQRAGTGRSHSG